MFEFDELWEPSPEDPKYEIHSDCADEVEERLKESAKVEVWDPEEMEVEETRIEIIVRHQIHGSEVRVVLPQRAKFRHVRRALARHLGCEEDLTKVRLVNKDSGAYGAQKDYEKVGDVRLIYMIGQDLARKDGGDAVASLSDGEVSEEEIEKPIPSAAQVVARVVKASAARKKNEKGSGGTRRAIAHPVSMSVAAAAGRSVGVPQYNRMMMRPPFPGPAGAPTPGIRPDVTHPQQPATQAKMDHTSPSLSRDQAVGLMKDMLNGFRAGPFQQKLTALEKHARVNAMSFTEFVQLRQELFLSVQSRVLPKYGFEGSQDGMFKMMGVVGPFLNDPEFAQLSEETNAVAGVNLARERWSSLSKACEKLDATAV